MLSYLCVIPLRSHLHLVPPMLVADGVWHPCYFPPLGSVWTGSSQPHILTGRTRLPTPRSRRCLSTLDMTPTVLITLVSHPTDLQASRDCVAFFCEEHSATAGLRQISLFPHFHRAVFNKHDNILQPYNYQNPTDLPTARRPLRTSVTKSALHVALCTFIVVMRRVLLLCRHVDYRYILNVRTSAVEENYSPFQ